VIDDERHLKGVITMDIIRPFMFGGKRHNLLSIQEIMIVPPVLIYLDDNMIAVIKKFDETETWILPVIDHEKLVGFISKSSILSRYRQLLKMYS
jgi:CIC family chloride channel protein